jgi:predicted aspartyl protease
LSNNETWANNEGLFVKAKLQNKCLAFLIDTGANVTILSKQFIENIQPSLLSQVNPVNVHLVTATGETCNMILHYWHNEIKELTPLLSINCFHLSEHHSY